MFSLSAKQQLLPRLPTIVKNPYFCCSNPLKGKTNFGEFIFQKPLRKVCLHPQSYTYKLN